MWLPRYLLVNIRLCLHYETNFNLFRSLIEKQLGVGFSQHSTLDMQPPRQMVR